MDIKLKELEDCDENKVANWLDFPHIAKWFVHKDTWMEEIKQRRTKYSFIKHYIVLIDGKEIGFCQYYDYVAGGEDFHKDLDVNRTYGIDYFIADKNYLGKGYGTELVDLLTKTVFLRTNAEQIIVQPEKENDISRKTLLSANYVYDSKRDIFAISRGTV